MNQQRQTERVQFDVFHTINNYCHSQCMFIHVSGSNSMHKACACILHNRLTKQQSTANTHHSTIQTYIYISHNSIAAARATMAKPYSVSELASREATREAIAFAARRAPDIPKRSMPVPAPVTPPLPADRPAKNAAVPAAKKAAAPRPGPKRSRGSVEEVLFAKPTPKVRPQD